MEVTTVGLDLAKNIFQVHGVTDAGDVAFNRALRRSQLLAAAKIAFACIAPGPEPAAAGTPWQKAHDRARSKAELASRAGLAAELQDLPILGVDTVVDVDGQEYGKAADVRQAERMLRSLIDRRHRVHTAHCLVTVDGPVAIEVATSEVVGRNVSEAALAAYLQSGQWRGKAGAYGIQDAEQPFLELLDGDFDTVVGLSVAVVRRLLQDGPS